MYSTQLRISDELHLKARVLAAYKNLSLNAFVTEAIEEKIARHEARFGEIPTLHGEERE
jgi:predicted HicB family RNase H-like nuclease